LLSVGKPKIIVDNEFASFKRGAVSFGKTDGLYRGGFGFIRILKNIPLKPPKTNDHYPEEDYIGPCLTGDPSSSHP
jgi:hypothetical protein